MNKSNNTRELSQETKDYLQNLVDERNQAAKLKADSSMWKTQVKIQMVINVLIMESRNAPSINYDDPLDYYSPIYLTYFEEEG